MYLLTCQDSYVKALLCHVYWWHVSCGLTLSWLFTLNCSNQKGISAAFLALEETKSW